MTKRLAIVPDEEKGVYPFSGIRLDRADIEWLLANHESGRGPVDLKDPSQRDRPGLDLRGADLSSPEGGPALNLRRLPLAHLLGGTEGLDHSRAVQLQWSDLSDSSLQGAFLEKANLRGAQLEQARLEDAYLLFANLQEVGLMGAHLEGAFLMGASLHGACLESAHLEGANLFQADLEGKHTAARVLPPADLRYAFFDSQTDFNEATLADSHGVGIRLAHAHWNGMNLSVIPWSSIKMLYDEYKARHMKRSESEPAEYEGSGRFTFRESLAYSHQEAVRANRQLATVLRDQGLSEEAEQFAYRAQELQRIVFRLQDQKGRWLLSWFLFLIAGYGYRLWHSLATYLVAMGAFAFFYWWKAGVPLVEAPFVSLSAFHGRGILPELYKAGQPGTYISGVEAFIGLIVEATFIATLTQRFFGK